MKIINKVLIAIFLPGIAVFAGILFWPFLLEQIIKPLALALWLFLRIFLLSIDQKIIWGALILAVFIIFIFRFKWPEQSSLQDESPLQNMCLTRLEKWRMFFSVEPRDSKDMINIKKELALMLVSIYASRKHIPDDYIAYNAFKQREIPLPDNIYLFLFADETKKRGPDLLKWFRRISRQETREYKRMLKESLNFLETFLEIKDEHKSSGKNND